MAGFLKLVPQYVVGGRLGIGGMGVVHLGTMVTPAGERRVAIKRILAAGDEAATERIVAEARLVFQLTHANICQVLDLAANDEGTFIVMEYINGLDLQALIGSLAQKGELLDVPLAVKVAAEVAEALDFAHHVSDSSGHPLGLVHGDVTPKNILLSRDGEVKLADFGVARAIGTLAPGNRMRGGTPGFIAPEVRESAGDQRTDLYALGVTLYVALSGAKPSARVDLDALRTKRPDVTAELCEILERAMAPRPQDRFSSAGELEQALTVHLARRFPSVTRASLRDIVRAHTRTGENQSLGKGAALKSLTRADTLTTVFESEGSLVLSSDDDGAPAAGAARRTEAFSAGKRRRLKDRLRALAALVALGGALSVARWQWARSREVPAPASPTPAPAPIAATIPQPAPATTSIPESAPRPRPLPQHVATQARAHPEMGYLTINAVPWGSVYVDGKLVSDETPVYRVPVLAGKHRVTISGNPARAHASRPREVIVRSGETGMVSVKW